MTYQQVRAPLLPSPYVLPASDELGTRASSGTPGVAAWPAANRAIFVPFSLPVNMLMSGMSCWCTTTGSANFDLGLYDVTGVRLGSLGSTALAAAQINTWTPTNPILLLAGTLYFAAMAAGSTSSTFLRYSNFSAVNLRSAGYAQQISALALPAPATFAQFTSAYIPVLALSFAGVPA